MIQSVDRAIRILEVLQASRQLNLSDIAARLGIAASTAHGIIKTLQEHGMVLQEHGSSRYRIGPAVLKLGNVYLDTLELRARAVGWTEELARRTGYAVRTGVLLPGEVMIVHHIPRPDGSRQMPETGVVIPAHTCALGKAMLAYSPADTDTLLSQGDLPRMTGRTMTDPKSLRTEFAHIRDDAVATEQEEAIIGECGTAAAIFDSSDWVAGAVGVVVPMPEWPPEDTVIAAVREAARAISRELGAPRWPALH